MKKMQTKDLIMAGAFIALYVVVLFAVATILGFIPITYIMAPLILPIILGPIFCLYVTKIPKQWALIVFGLIVMAALCMSSIWLAWVWMIVLTIIAEFVARAGKYQSKKMYLMSYNVFALSCMSPFWTLIVAKQQFLDGCEVYYGAEYVATFDALTPSWIGVVFFLMCLGGGFIGGRFGMKVMSKYFEKAGII